MERSFKQTMYAVFDKLSGTLYPVFTASSDGHAVRTALKICTKYPRDCVVVAFGTYEVVTDSNADPTEALDPRLSAKFSLSDIRVLSWSAWRIPESAAEVLAPLGLTSDEERDIAMSKIQDLDSASREDVQKVVNAFYGKGDE